MTKHTLLALVAACGLAVPALAQSTNPTTAPAEQTRKEKSEDNLVVTQHELKLPGETIPYQATAGTIAIKDEAGKTQANFYFTAYEKTAAGEPVGRNSATRPVIFVFNGGPGAASVWLHLGVVGPQRIDFPKDGIPGPPPYRLVDNHDTWLAFADLVLIDPIGTGYSRTAPGVDGKQFFGVEQDINSVGDFIRLYLTRYGRWASPKFLAGESYGTTRAANLSEFLLDRYGINLNGVILVSTVLNFATLSPGNGNDVPFALFLPTYTVTAAHHKKLTPDLQQDVQRTLREVEAFAINDYLPALMKGDALPADQKEMIVARLARYTGLSEQYIRQSNLRVPPWAFQKEVLEADGKIIGRFDGRVTAYDPNPTATTPAFDPSYAVYIGPYTSTYHQYARNVLKYETDAFYEVLSGRVRPWDFGPAGNGFLNVADELRDAMLKSPSTKVFFAEGLYDFATPYFASDYTVNQLDLPESLRNNIVRRYYEGGHMMYHVDSERTKLSNDVRAFVESAVAK
jgi:carboxypeptidase C (cathepsin A)